MANLISCVSSLYDHWKMRYRDLIYGHMKIHKTAEDHGLFGPVFSVLRPKRPSVLIPSDHLYTAATNQDSPLQKISTRSATQQPSTPSKPSVTKVAPTITT